MKKVLLSFIAGLLLSSSMFAFTPPDEGMWLPMFIERLNYVDMKKMGLRLTAEELYSINQSCLKDAVVSLGGFCTAEVVSPKGLLFTNHHCGYEAIQSHSSIQHDYLTNGFWARSLEEELPNEGLTATFLIRMEDVTGQVLANVKDDMSEADREAAIAKVIKKLQKDNSEKGKYEVEVEDFFNGNEYYMFIYLEYKDVRLVGAPPSNIGKFGGDTDNWMWPRHTGDFSIFRIYTGPDGSPAEYSKNNIPLKPAHFLPISLKGVTKGDFSMIWGYPGSTDRYLTSYGVKMAEEISDPTIVKIRTKKLDIMREDMNSDPAIKIKYASKYAESANYWKYYIGEARGLKRLKVYDKKKALENEFVQWYMADNARREKYGNALKLIEKSYVDMQNWIVAMKYLEEAVFQGPECLYFSFGAYQLNMTLQKQAEKKGAEKESLNSTIQKQAETFKSKLEEHFKNYNAPTDKKLFAALLEMYYNNVPVEFHPWITDAKGKKVMLFDEVKTKYKGNFNLWAEAVFAKSIFVDQKKLETFLNKPNLKTLQNDPVFRLTEGMVSIIRELYGRQDEIETNLKKGNRLFVDALRQMYPDKKFYPNANSTMRMTYGQVLDYYPADAVHYDYRTTIDGIMEKEDPTNDEFIVEPKLKELWQKKDYGRYAGKDGKMYVCFITNHDISGGNSGSPVINGDGQLIGIAFDGNWEAMSGNIAFEPDLQRTINVDIRYVLFVIDKLAGAKNLIEELTIIE